MRRQWNSGVRYGEKGRASHRIEVNPKETMGKYNKLKDRTGMLELDKVFSRYYCRLHVACVSSVILVVFEFYAWFDLCLCRAS